MAYVLNPYSKPKFANNLRSNSAAFSTSGVFRIFPSTVPYPTAPINNSASIPAGHILTMTGLSFSSPSNIIFISGGPANANATAAGTLSWWSFHNSSVAAIGAIFSDSLSLPGGGGILTATTLTPTNGQNVTIALNLTVG